MQWLRFAALIIFASILQASIVDRLAITSLNINLNLHLILLVFFATKLDSHEAIITSFAIGFSADIIAIDSIVGPQMISFGIAGTILSNLSKVIAVNKMLYQSIAIFLTGLAAAVLTSLVLSFRVNGAEFNFMFIIGSSIYSSIAGPFLFVPCQWLMCIKKSKQQR